MRGILTKGIVGAAALAVAFTVGLPAPKAHAQAIGCAPVVGLMPVATGYIYAQGAADCTSPHLQTAAVKVSIYKNGVRIKTSPTKTCYPGQFSSNGWCLSPYAAAPNYAPRETFCGYVSISWKNSSTAPWNSATARTCAVY